MKNWLVIYDIRDEKRLQKVAKVMESYGIRVQKSVFEIIAKPSTINELYHKIEEIINEDEDFVVYFEVCTEDWQKQSKYGPGKFEILENESYNIL